MSDVLLQVEDLHKNFTVKDAQGRKKILKAVDGVSFSIERGKTLGLVGESGSGKTTTGRTVLRLTEPDGGRILYAGEDITHKNRKPLRRKMQIIFQNPTGSLDRKMRVLDIVAEGLTANRMTGSRAETEKRVMELLRSVGLQESDAYRYPGEFSGGQQQRIGIARALAVEPEFIVCDEPVSALDVSYQAQIVNMLEDLQKELGLTYLFISHDLSVVMHISDSIGVMYLGRLVETGPCEEVILHAAHPYTRALLAAIPVADPKIAKSRVRQTAVPERPRSSGGCAFCPRCPDAKSVCFEQTPDSREIAPGHFCACHLYG